MALLPDTLPLRGAHVPPAPVWWPPAPGWWLLLAALLAALAAWLFFRQRKAKRLRAWQALFDAADADESPGARIAAYSELLRRAAREIDANAANLHGEAWLRFLDGNMLVEGRSRGFIDGAGRVLLDGGYRRDVDADEADALRDIARARFLELMAGKR